MKILRVVWAIVAVLAFFLAWFVPVVSLPLLAAATVVALCLSRRAVVRAQGRVRLWAARPPLALLALIAAVALVPWVEWLAPREMAGPNPGAVPWWSLTPVEHLVRADSYWAGMIAPVLLVAVPVTLAIAIAVTLVLVHRQR